MGAVRTRTFAAVRRRQRVLKAVRVLRNHRLHCAHARCWDATELIDDVDTSPDDVARAEEDASVGSPCAPMPRPLPQLTDVEQHRDATKKDRVHHALAADSIPRWL